MKWKRKELFWEGEEGFGVVIVLQKNYDRVKKIKSGEEGRQGSIFNTSHTNLSHSEINLYQTRNNYNLVQQTSFDALDTLTLFVTARHKVC